MRQCRACQQSKPLAEYNDHPKARGGKDTICRECAKAYKRDWYRKNTERRLERNRKWAEENREQVQEISRAGALRRQYGLTVGEYDALLAGQDGRCAICRKPPGRHRLSVDHCHETGRVRGLLCKKCNTGIGMLGDTEERIRAVLKYLSMD